MIIKKISGENPFIQHLSKRKFRYFFIGLVLVLYTAIIFLVGGYSHKVGFFGRVIKPAIQANVRIPVNYLKSMRANPEKIVLDIRHKDFQKIAFKREKAIERGVLLSTGDDYVQGEIRWRHKKAKVDLRLKGDLSDHWGDPQKWSFRIKTKSDQTIMGMRKFSLQHPRTRGYLNDWILHKLLKRVGGFPILKYEFVNLTINGKDHGIYLMEEHFDKMLLKHNQFTEAPIIRFYDHLLWYAVDPKIGFAKAHLNEHYTLSTVDAFNSGETGRDKLLTMYFKRAKDLLEAFRRGELKTHQVFHVKKMAKLFAIIDLLGYHHSTAYSNIRFFYNPTTSILEPIGYDNTFIARATAIQGQTTQFKVLPGKRAGYIDYDEYQLWYSTIFSDINFYQAYVKELERISSQEFLDAFFKEIDNDLKQALDQLYKTFPGYQFTKKALLYDNQEFIKRRLRPGKPAVLAYFSGTDLKENKLILEIGNIHSLPVEILSLSVNNSVWQRVGEGKNILWPKNKFAFVNFNNIVFGIPEATRWQQDLLSNMKVQYRIFGTTTVQETAVTPWSHFNKGILDEPFVRRESNISGFNFLDFDEKNGKLVVKTGEWVIDRNILIPEGMKVICGPGTKLSLGRNAMIISFSPFQFIGSATNPITIESTDGSGQGILIAEARGKSIFENVHFHQLSAPRNDDWQVDAAVNLYEADGIFVNCSFEKIGSGDALSIIRSNFEIDRVSINKINGNAIRLVYANGKISNSKISATEVNGLYSTGSEVECKNTSFEQTTGSGIIGAEKSSIRLYHVDIDHSHLGVDARDMSVVNAENISISHSKFGVASHQHSSAFGPAKAIFKGLILDQVELKFLVDDFSQLILDGTKIEGNRSDLATRRYPVNQ